MQIAISRALAGALLLTVAAPLTMLAQHTADLPLKYVGPPTSEAITAQDLMTRLYIFADDSLMGRQVRTEYNDRGTAYLEREVRRMGLKPAGDSGGFFQHLPMLVRALDPASTITVGGQTFRAGSDFLARSTAKPRQFVDVEVVFGGRAADTTNLLVNSTVRGKAVLMLAPAAGAGFSPRAFAASAGGAAYLASIAGATVVMIRGDSFPDAESRAAMTPARLGLLRTFEQPIALTVTTKVAEAMLGSSIAEATKGATGRRLSSDVRFTDELQPLGRNVVAIVEGSDPVLKHEYIAVGSHNDHVGFNTRPVDHDSLKAYMMVVRPQGADSPNRPPTPAQVARVRELTDSLRALHPARRDSIFNGADDDGSGTVTALEVAEAFAAVEGKARPKRSILFVWHTGEEAGLWGADYFTENPTVPREAIVAQLNMDMVGRGRATDETGEAADGSAVHGGPGYLQLIGSRRLSTELGDVIEAVNTTKKLGFNFDYSMDANGHPQNIYCRSDHYMYARHGIPVVFLSTGGHADYHQVTDEPQYIDYDHMRNVGRLVMESAVHLANLDHRIVVDKPKPDPRGACVQ